MFSIGVIRKAVVLSPLPTPLPTAWLHMYRTECSLLRNVYYGCLIINNKQRRKYSHILCITYMSFCVRSNTEMPKIRRSHIYSATNVRTPNLRHFCVATFCVLDIHIFITYMSFCVLDIHNIHLIHFYYCLCLLLLLLICYF
jgi:hypothetical protein